MKVSNLPDQVVRSIRKLRYDRILEKHEGPENWDSVFRYHSPEVMLIEGRHVLLPVAQEQHRNISVLRTIVSDDGESLTIFLKDTTYLPDPKEEMFFAGRVAVCDKLPGTKLYVAIMYHEWFIISFPRQI